MAISWRFSCNLPKFKAKFGDFWRQISEKLAISDLGRLVTLVLEILLCWTDGEEEKCVPLSLSFSGVMIRSSPPRRRHRQPLTITPVGVLECQEFDKELVVFSVLNLFGM